MTRSHELHRKYRRILFWSLVAAVVVHVGTFVLWPEMRTEAVSGWTAEAETEEVEGTSKPLEVHVEFGPPGIMDVDGSLVRVDRRMEVDHVIALPTACVKRGSRMVLPARGTVKLRVRSSGRAEALELVDASGSECADSVITRVAGALDYRWLPDERFPAPVELMQPVALREKEKRE